MTTTLLGGQWSCTACTFVNDNNSKNNNNEARNKSSLSCAMCGAAPAAAAAVQDEKKKQKKKQTKQQTLSFAIGTKRQPPPKSSKSAATTTTTKTTTSNKHHSSFSKYVRTTIPSSKEIDATLKECFGLSTLRPLQEQVILTAVRDKQSQLVVLATGGGKSLCYQLPACLLGGITIVISPLIALMQDQVTTLREKHNIPAACISSAQTESQNRTILLQQQQQDTTTVDSSSSSSLVLLYITPESIQTNRMQTLLRQWNQQKRLAMFAVDEAHCLSSWGHDFRPAYRKLHWLRTSFPNIPCMACTATATPKVMKDIQSCLQLPIQHQGRLDRHNIYYKVQYNHNNNNNNNNHNHNNANNNNNNQSNNNNSKSNLPPLQHLCQTIRELYYEKNDWKTTKGGGGGGCGIVYVHKRDDTTMLARAITTKAKVPAAAYHAGLPKQERQRVLEEFIRGSTSTSTTTDSQQKNPPPLKIVVATVAFGMGIDVANVRVVIHWNMPKSLEAFAQESGRAGRDGLPCHSILYYNPEDYSKYQFLLHKQYESNINNNNQKNNKTTTTNDTAATSSSPSAEQFLQAKLEALDQMRDYCTLPQCRRKTILLHFGGGTSTTQEEEDVCQQTCDYCSNPKLVTRNLQSMLVSKRSTTFSNNTRTNNDNNNNKWDGQWKKPHGDDGNNYDDYDDDNNDDWGNGFVGDLQITGSLSYGGGGDSGSSNKRRKMGGFTKASSLLNVLNKYEKMEENSSNQQESNSGFVRFGVNNKSTTAIIPEHFKASTVNHHSTATKPKTSVAKPPEKSAKELQQDLDRINAEREKRMQALLSKQKKRKEEAAAKAATSSSATATVQAPPTLTFGSHKRRRT